MSGGLTSASNDVFSVVAAFSVDAVESSSRAQESVGMTSVAGKVLGAASFNVDSVGLSGAVEEGSWRALLDGLLSVRGDGLLRGKGRRLRRLSRSLSSAGGDEFLVVTLFDFNVIPESSRASDSGGRSSGTDEEIVVATFTMEAVDEVVSLTEVLNRELWLLRLLGLLLLLLSVRGDGLLRLLRLLRLLLLLSVRGDGLLRSKSGGLRGESGSLSSTSNNQVSVVTSMDFFIEEESGRTLESGS